MHVYRPPVRLRLRGVVVEDLVDWLGKAAVQAKQMVGLGLIDASETSLNTVLLGIITTCAIARSIVLSSFIS